MVVPLCICSVSLLLLAAAMSRSTALSLIALLGAVRPRFQTILESNNILIFRFWGGGTCESLNGGS